VNQEFAQLNERYTRNNAEINSIAADIVAQSQPAPTPRQQPRYPSTDPGAGLPVQPAPSSSPVIDPDKKERSAFDEAKWQRGPAMVSLSDIAQLNLPQGYVFGDAADTKRLMEAMQNPTSGQESGFVAPNDFKWFAVFEYDETGHVLDDEKNSLDADKILASIQQATEKSNELRRQRGWSPMTVTGWYTPPRYNPTTHNLEWAINGESQAEAVVNYQTRILGRSGVMRAVLVGSPSELPTAMPEYRTLLSLFAYKPGSTYAEFRQGDKIAKYGLSALVVGGATAVAVKSGAAKWLVKVIIAAFVAVGAFGKRLFGRKKSLSTG
jgi:uncharacterized membrane-anchored protein